MRIGIDFDNTIVCYDEVLYRAAVERGLIVHSFAGGKRAIRDAIRLRVNGENEWIELQAHVYGHAIADAPPFPGFCTFVASAKRVGASLCIVSHKSQYAAAGPNGPDLRMAARKWLVSNDFEGAYGAFSPDSIFFEGTLSDKLARIASQGCTHFIDDLDEVLSHPDFPGDVRRMLFSRDTTSFDPQNCFDNWDDIRSSLFGTPV